MTLGDQIKYKTCFGSGVLAWSYVVPDLLIGVCIGVTRPLALVKRPYLLQDLFAPGSLIHTMYTYFMLSQKIHIQGPWGVNHNLDSQRH